MGYTNYWHQHNDFTDEQWNTAKPYYNHSDNSGIYNDLASFSDEYNVLVRFDAGKLTQEDMNNIQIIHPILGQYKEQTGKFELGNLTITINKIVENTVIEMTNPDFDKKLLNIE